VWIRRRIRFASHARPESRRYKRSCQIWLIKEVLTDQRANLSFPNLLAYRRHFFIVDRYFIETLGLLPEDPDWELIGRDWVKPRQMDARARLYGTLIRRRLSAGLT
jgi:hypothetical protein